MPHPKCSCIYTVEFAQKSQLGYNKSLPISALSAIRPSLNYLSSGSVNTKYNPPISSGQNVAWVKIFEQKRVCLPVDSYGRVSPKQSPRWPESTPLYADTTLSPALNYHYAAAAQISDFLKLHWGGAGRGKESGSVRTSSGIRVHGQLAICSMPVLTLLTSTHAK